MRSLSTAPGCLRLATGGVPILTVRGCGPWHGDAYLLFPLPVADWPELDRERWQAARAPADFLEDPKLASGWSPARRRIVEQAYGQFLAFLNRNGALDPLCAPPASARPRPACATSFWSSAPASPQ